MAGAPGVRLLDSSIPSSEKELRPPPPAWREQCGLWLPWLLTDAEGGEGFPLRCGKRFLHAPGW